MTNYCFKAVSLASKVQRSSINLSPQVPMYQSVYTERTQDYVLDLTVTMDNLPSFALFGLTNKVQIVSSNLSVNVPSRLAQGALVCLKCDVNASASTFSLSGTGQNISGLVMQSLNQITINQSFIQFRLSGSFVGGLVVKCSQIQISITNCNISGYAITGDVSGRIIAQALDQIQITADLVYICVNLADNIGQGQNSVVIQGSIEEKCNLCLNANYQTYGICQSQLQYGELINHQLVCKSTFIFDGEQCVCKEGDVVNGNICINILVYIQELKTQNACLNQYGYKFIDGSCVQVRCPIQGQTLKNGVCQCSISNAIIYDEQCACPVNSIQIGTICTCPVNSVLIDGVCVCNIITGQIIQNGQCICSQDQYISNGACKCLTSGAFINNGVCTCGVDGQNISNFCFCPSNSVLIQGICTCNIIGQTIQSGVCKCLTSGAIIINDSCTCGVDGVNISNTCGCPTNSSLVSGVCTCNTISGQIIQNGVCTCYQTQIINNGSCQCSTFGAIISNGTCTCGVDGLNISNTCGCPANSILVNGACKCNFIVGQTMQNGVCTCSEDQYLNNGVCQCLTSGAFISNGVCTCGVDGQNISNNCNCPANSIQACKNVVDPQLVNGQCYILNQCNKNIGCSQQVFIAKFDIQRITNYVNSNSYNNGYVFDKATIITNSFIDIADNSYGSIVYPLFKEQNQFINIKIQIGMQIVNNGSIVSSSYVVIVNQVNIIAKTNTSISINSGFEMNILQASSVSAQISNLFINLNFSMSSSNLSLISTISGDLNVSGYQILGCYQISKQIAMISINTNSAVLRISNINFKPTIYNTYNDSSYLFYQIQQSTINLVNVALIIGSYNNQYYSQYGGIISALSINVNVVINTVISDIYQYYNSNIQYSGVLVGRSSDSQNSIIITNICLQHNISSKISTKINNFGLISNYNGTAILQNLSVTIFMNASISCFGIVSEQYGNSTFTNVQTLQQIISVYNYGSNPGSLFGSLIGQNQGIIDITNATVKFNCSALSGVGGLVGNCSNFLIKNTIMQNCMINGSNSSGGFVGMGYGSGPSFVNNSNLTNCTCNGSNNVGGFIGYSLNITIINVNLSNCLSNSKQDYSSTYSGGLVGISLNLTIKNINIQYNKVKGYISGGITGKSYAFTIQSVIMQNCDINSTGSSSGFVGSSSAMSIINNSILVNCSIGQSASGYDGYYGYYQSGGLIGNSTDISITNINLQYLVINGSGHVGGIIGRFYGTNDLSFQNVNISNSVANSSYISGGLVGTIQSDEQSTQNYIISLFENINLVNCSVSGSSLAGGLAGQMQLYYNYNSLYYQPKNIINNTNLNNCSINSSGDSGGLIGESSHYITVYNVILQNIQVGGSQNSGGFVGDLRPYFESGSGSLFNNSTVVNCTVSSFSSYGSGSVGGLVGVSSDLIILNITLQNFQLKSSSYVGSGPIGGIVGRSSYSSNLSIKSVKIQNCVVNSSGQSGGFVGTIECQYKATQYQIRSVFDNLNLVNCSVSGSSYAGGLVGRIYYTSQQANNYYEVKIIITNTNLINFTVNSSGYSGGLIGDTSDLNVENVNLQNYQVNSSSSAGGLIGNSSDLTILRVILQNFSVNGSNYVGGLVGDSNTISVQQLMIKNYSVNGSEGCGGFSGRIQSGNIDNSTSNNYSVNGSNNVGGIVGQYLSPLLTFQINNVSTSNLNISGMYYVGGFTGYQSTQSSQSYKTSYIYNSSIKNSIILGTVYVGGFIGSSYNTRIQISSSTIQTIKITSSMGIQAGMVLGYNQYGNTFDITTSKSLGTNYVNNNLQINCNGFTNTYSVTQC
ncbi:Conserved_hypothetical protein [Hexamita inflata]|uniref:Uncharacterized protein n=1 Tax=Hexamita inflata TaxID=28002 RepID=A0AA86QJJ7_9EUKA|nr:Conserved hypothetical protein [Hexamita inflata]